MPINCTLKIRHGIIENYQFKLLFRMKISQVIEAKIFDFSIEIFFSSITWVIKESSQSFDLSSSSFFGWLLIWQNGCERCERPRKFFLHWCHRRSIWQDVTRLQSAKNRITDLDEELRIIKQDLKILNLLQQFNVSNKLKEKKKCDKERFNKLVETSKFLLNCLWTKRKNPQNMFCIIWFQTRR